MDTLFFNTFAEKWTDGMPIGNGRLAAMVWGGAEEDVISLNHEWLWTGNFKDRECEAGAHFLPYVRDYLKKGQNFKATALAAIAFGGNGGISPLPRRMDSYQPAGELILRHGRAQSIARTLDMESGIADSRKTIDGQGVSLTAMCHAEADLLALLWQADAPQELELRFVREEQAGTAARLELQQDGLRFFCDGGKGVGFCVRLRWQTDAQTELRGDALLFRSATRLQIWGDIGTEHLGIEQELSLHPLAGEFDVLCKSQRAAFSAEMRKFSLTLSDEQTPELEKLSIEERKARVAAGGRDAQLVSLFARYGAYLMVAGSLRAELPLHLQGKWNRELVPKWNSDYHFNINLQMNYWFSDALQMDRFSRQMTDYVLRLLPKARIAAERIYGCRGLLYPLNSDIWANVTAESYNYAVWIAAAGWLSAHFWRSWQHTHDRDYLRDYAYPFIREAAQFYEDYIVLDEDGVAQLMPSQSPENRYAGCGYFPVSMCISSAMDVQIAYETLTFAAEAAGELGIDAERAAKWTRLRDQLPPFCIGRDGRLLEWDSDDREEIEKGHRHLSHLYGVYPGNLFTRDRRREQFDAAYKSLEYRLAHSGGYTGWSSAWSACLYARFGEGEKVEENLCRLLTVQSSNTFLDLHPDFYPASRSASTKPKDDPLLFSEPEAEPPMIFQIDGNLGATAALIEALVQECGGTVTLLPAVASDWKRGRFAGVRVPGGHVLDVTFENGSVTACGVIMGFAGTLCLRGRGIAGGECTLTGTPGEQLCVPCEA